MAPKKHPILLGHGAPSKQKRFYLNDLRSQTSLVRREVSSCGFFVWESVLHVLYTVVHHGLLIAEGTTWGGSVWYPRVTPGSGES